MTSSRDDSLPDGLPDSAAGVLALARARRAEADRAEAPVAHKVKPAQVERLVDEAIARFMPDEAEQLRRRAADGRHFTIDHHGLSFTGTSTVYGELDLAPHPAHHGSHQR